jgi:hypothetical protein
MVHGTWDMVYGTWYMVHGEVCWKDEILVMVYVIWFMVYGTCSSMLER